MTVSRYTGDGQRHADDIGKEGARGHGVVVENRRFAQSEGFEVTDDHPHRYPPSKWLELAMNLKFRLERLHRE